MAVKGKPATKTAPDPVVENLQRELKQQGFYSGEIDGFMGESTKSAVKARDEKAATDAKAKSESEERELKKLELQQSGRKTDAEAAETTRKTKAREERSGQAASPAGIATQIGATTAAPLAGVYAGRVAGLGINKLMDISQESKNKALAGVAADRTAGLTTREGARAAAIRSGAMPSENALLRVGGRMAPHFVLGGMMAGKGGALLAQGDEEGPFYPEMANRAAALGMLGAGTGIAERGVTYGIAPGVAPDAQAMSVIESNQLRRNNAAAPSAAPSAPRTALPGSRADMLAQAKRYNIKGRSNMSVEQLREAVGEAVRNTPAPRGGAATKMLKSLAGPGAAAGIAYAMTPDRAEAADGSSAGGQAEGLTNAGVAGGAAYGVRKGIEALPAAVGGALGTAGEAMAPVTIDAMTDYSPDELAQGRNMLARNLPSFLRAGAVEDAYQMAQVPERSPVRNQIASSEMAPIQDMPAEGDFDGQMAELEALLGQIGAAQEPGPVANAANSQRVAAMPPQNFAPSNIPTNRLLAQY